MSKNINILYIEDDPNIAEVYSLMINENLADVTIKVFQDSATAINELRSNSANYNLIISDYKLGGSTGGEIFKFVNGQMLGIPFILLTGVDCTGEEDFKNFFNSHVRNAVLIKPALENEIIEKIKWCLESENDLMKIYNKPVSNCDEKVTVGSDVFLRINQVPCDVYLKMNQDKYVKIINKNEMFERALIEKLILKGIAQFFVNRSELTNYGDSVIRSLATVLKVKKKSGDEIQKSQLNNKALNVVRNNLIKCGFNEQIIKATDDVLELQLSLISSSKDIEDFVEKYQLFKKSNAEHTRIINYIVVAVLKDLTWDSESTIHKMSLACLLHDVSLPEKIYQTTHYHGGIDDSLTDEELKIYLRHPEESSHIAKNFESVAAGIEQYIYEHHELPDGTGFPRKLNFNHVHPLSAVLHISDLIADLLWANEFDSKKVKSELLSKRSFYLRGFYRKPFEAAFRLFNN